MMPAPLFTGYFVVTSDVSPTELGSVVRGPFVSSDSLAVTWSAYPAPTLEIQSITLVASGGSGTVPPGVSWGTPSTTSGTLYFQMRGPNVTGSVTQLGDYDIETKATVQGQEYTFTVRVAVQAA